MQSNNTNYAIQSVKRKEREKLGGDGGENISNLTILIEKNKPEGKLMGKQRWEFEAE